MKKSGLISACLSGLLPAVLVAGAGWSSAAQSVPQAPRSAATVTNFTQSGVFTAPTSGTYFFELLGAGGAGGAQSSGWDAGGGGGGGGYVAGSVTLSAGQQVRIVVGQGGRGPATRAFAAYVDGPDGGDSTLALAGDVVLRAEGGQGGRGVDSRLGGSGGSWAIDESVVQDGVGFKGGDGGRGLIRIGFSGGYTQGGEGGSAANSTGPGRDGTTQRCVWTAVAVPGNLPSGGGAFGYFGGYDNYGNCGTDLSTAGPTDYWPGDGYLDGELYGGGGGGTHNGYNYVLHAGSGANGFARVTHVGVASPEGLSATPSGSIAVFMWEPVEGVDRYRVTLTPGDLVCESDATSCTIRGLSAGTRYAARVTAFSGAEESDPSSPVSFVAGNPPGAPTSVRVSPGAGAAVVSWGPPSDRGDSALVGYSVVARPGNRTCEVGAEVRSCDISGLTNGVPYTFTVYAENGSGRGTGAQSGAAVAFSWPGTPTNVRRGIATSSSAEVRWDSAASNGSPITSYVVSVSRDAGATWTEREVDGTTLKSFLPELAGPARAALVRVASVNAAGRSAWSKEVLVTSLGARPMRVEVVDAQGVPVIGGAITWAMRDANVKSSATYGLTGDGVIEFPLAPAGWVQVDVTGALTADGAEVSGRFVEVLGFEENVLQLPSAPSATRAVRVVLPSGGGVLPVPGVTISFDDEQGQFSDEDCLEWAYGTLTAEDWCLTYGAPSQPRGVHDTYEVDGFVFSVDRTASPIRTNSEGVAVIEGFTSGQLRVTVSYDDGIITQGKEVVLRNPSTDVELDYMPWIEVADDDVSATAGALVPLEISVETGGSQFASAEGKAVRTSNVRVTVIPPKGAPAGKCKPTLSARANSAGVARLSVCATKSGEYRFRTSGAAAVGSVFIRVKGTAPMRPTAVSARSLSVGTARVTWNPPAYSGGAPVTGYVITASAPGEKTLTRSVSGSARNVRLAGLANATEYTVTIRARTARGLGDVAVTTVPVA